MSESHINAQNDRDLQLKNPKCDHDAVLAL